MAWHHRFEYRAAGFERMLEVLQDLGWKVQMTNRGAKALLKVSKGKAKGSGTWERVNGVWTGDFKIRNRWLSDVPFNADDALSELSGELVRL